MLILLGILLFTLFLVSMVINKKYLTAQNKLNKIDNYITNNTWLNSRPSFENNPPNSSTTIQVVEADPLINILNEK